jgi:DNA-binding SARP family transcriptional activator/predicted ATPase
MDRRSGRARESGWLGGAVALEIRFLGEMAIARGGLRLDLPPSRKTRGLLAYLALTGRPHRRERLCQLLWDVADDPRGALRWSLSRLRALVDEPDRPRIRVPRDSVAFDANGAWIDITALKQRCSSGLEKTPIEELTELARQFRGELLEGLDLDDFLDFQSWCVAEREEARKLQANLLSVLVARLAGRPEAALPHARALAAVDPLDEAARAGLVRLLASTGRRREAEQQFEAACRLLKELGRPVSAELEAALKGAPGATPVAMVAESPAADLPPAPVESDVVGRERERRRLAELLEEVAGRRRARALLVTGEPGLGKSRLLEELRRAAQARGGTVLEGRAFEAEAGRPFGPWIDALQQLPAAVISSALRSDLGALLPENAGEDGAPRSRDRLFGAVVQLLAERSQSAPPVVLTLDDVHCLDGASAELLHFVARMSRHRPLFVVLTARAGDLFDNEAMQRTLRSLREMGLLEEFALGPLGREETRELVHSVAGNLDTESVFAESGGNPFFALEVARWLRESREPGPRDAPTTPPNGMGEPATDTTPAPDRESRLPGSLTELIRHRVERLPPEAGDVLRWAAVLGRGFDVDRLGELMALDLDRLLGALHLLERHELLRARDEAGAYEFSHEIVRRAIYSELSQPRRRLMHRRIAQRLGEVEAAETVAADLAHHAALAGENALAARACVRAGGLFLRQFANGEAWATARRGRRHAEEVPEPERTSLLLMLLQVELQARRPTDVDAAARELETLSERALEQGDAEHARLGLHMLAYLRWEEGNLGDAQRQMMRAEKVSRAGDERAQIVAMAEAARCLVLLERDLPHAQALALEAGARSARAGVRPSAIADAEGLLRQHQGRLDEATELFEQARLQARQEGDAMGEFQALEHLVVLRQRQSSWVEARRLGAELERLGSKLREGSEAPFARSLLALSRRAMGEPGAKADLEAAAQELRLADAKLRLAYVLTQAARMDLESGDPRQSRTYAAEAQAAAAALGRPTATLQAGVTLARARLELGEEVDLRRLLEDLRAASAGAAEFARGELEELLRDLGAEKTGRDEAGRRTGTDR